jgi:hypothetical protein
LHYAGMMVRMCNQVQECGTETPGCGWSTDATAHPMIAPDISHSDAPTISWFRTERMR